MISFKVTPRELELIDKVLDRFEGELGVKVDRQTYAMDLCAAHNDIPLDFEKLLAFPAFDLIHDVSGINYHLNRETGRLEDCFVPRCAANQ